MDLLLYAVALEWLDGDGLTIAAKREQVSTKTLAGEYEATEATDLILIGKAEERIAAGDTDAARDLLSQVQVATYRRDQVLATAAPRGWRIELEFTPDERQALIREAKAFE